MPDPERWSDRERVLTLKRVDAIVLFTKYPPFSISQSVPLKQRDRGLSIVISYVAFVRIVTVRACEVGGRLLLSYSLMFMHVYWCDCVCACVRVLFRVSEPCQPDAGGGHLPHPLHPGPPRAGGGEDGAGGPS